MRARAPQASTNLQLDNGTAAFKAAATWEHLPGLSNASASSFRSLAFPQLYMAVADAGTPCADPAPRARNLLAARAPDLQHPEQATWSLEPPNVLQQQPPVPLPSQPAGTWHSLRSLAG